MPPAFNLSQDQTLKFNLCCWFSSASHSFRIKEENVFVFTSNLSTQFSKFSRSSKASWVIFASTGYSRLSVRWSIFKEQFVALFELTSLRIIRLKFVLSSLFENIFYFLFSLDCHLAATRMRIMHCLFTDVKKSFQNFSLQSFFSFMFPHCY